MLIQLPFANYKNTIGDAVKKYTCYAFSDVIILTQRTLVTGNVNWTRVRVARSFWAGQQHTWVYTEVSGLASWSENFKWYTAFCD